MRGMYVSMLRRVQPPASRTSCWRNFGVPLAPRVLCKILTLSPLAFTGYATGMGGVTKDCVRLMLGTIGSQESRKRCSPGGCGHPCRVACH
jgi:hypothetical protein